MIKIGDTLEEFKKRSPPGSTNYERTSTLTLTDSLIARSVKQSASIAPKISNGA